MKSVSRIGILLAATVAFLLTASSAAQEAALPDPDAPGLDAAARVEALRERIRIEQSRLTSLEARFTQRKESDLLLEAEVSEGIFRFRAPDLVRWEFDPPVDTVVLLRGDVLITWYRALGRAEKVRMDGQGEKILQFLGAGPSLERLQNYFDLEVGFPDDPEAPFRLLLEPRFERVSRRLREIEIRLDRTLYVPVYLRYAEANGEMTELQFEPLRVNEALADEFFELDLPDDVELREIEIGR